ncbi:MAG: hypothetical protein V4534_00890 [Myxococcota bacterium]
MQLLKRGVCGGGKGKYNQITLFEHERSLSQDMPEATLDKITDIGFTDVFGNGKSHMTILAYGARDQDNAWRFGTLPKALYANKLMALFNAP